MSNILHLTDNMLEGKRIYGEELVKDVIRISNIGRLENAPELLVFPKTIEESNGNINELSILTAANPKIDEDGKICSIKVHTGNLMGFVGINGTSISIHSRFCKKNDDGSRKDFLLYYMLQKVFSMNVIDLLHSSDNSDKILDFLMFLFPFFLKRAMSQGVFREYQTAYFDDSRVKGSINIPQYVQKDMPFRGRVSYRHRQYSRDNNMTQLIRHTIEYLRKHPVGSLILAGDHGAKEYVDQIVTVTPTYNPQKRVRIVNANIRPKVHPYFLQYKSLQQLCVCILRHDSLKYGDAKEKIYGILFDGAWLWEEYLNTILREINFHHPTNRDSEGGIRMFKKIYDEENFYNNYRKIYPDFYRDDYILDAKYKHLDQNIVRSDLYQVVTYMYSMSAPFGGYIYPDSDGKKIARYKLAGMGSDYNPETSGGIISVIPFNVPDSCDWEDFVAEMKNSETKLKKMISSTSSCPFPKE